MSNSTTTDTIDETDEQFATRTLRAFGDSWKRPGNFAEEATLLEIDSDYCEKEITTTQSAVETRQTESMPPSEYEETVQARVSIDSRYADARDEFLDETVEYVSEQKSIDTCPECKGDGEYSCPNCSTGRSTCGNCRGDGVEDCSECRGWGKKGPVGRTMCSDCRGTGDETRTGEGTCGTCHGKGHDPCSNCSGAGEHQCQTCDGAGMTTCGTCGGSTIVVCNVCDGEEKLVTAELGSIEFSTSEDETVRSDLRIPPKYIEDADGIPMRTEEDWHGIPDLDTEADVRTEVHHRSVEAKRIVYEYDGDDWKLYEVEERVRAQSYHSRRLEISLRTSSWASYSSD